MRVSGESFIMRGTVKGVHIYIYQLLLIVHSFYGTWRRRWQPTPVFLPGESHGRRSLVGYSPRGRKESDTTEQLHFHFMVLHCTG